jgi:hypothetical protein
LILLVIIIAYFLNNKYFYRKKNMPLSINPYIRAGASQVLTNPVVNTVAGNVGLLPGILSPEKQRLDNTVNRLSGGIGSGLNGNTAGSTQVNLSQVATSITALGAQSGLISQQRANQIGAAVGLANVISSTGSISPTQAAGALGVPGPGIPLPPTVATVIGNIGQAGTVIPGPAALPARAAEAIASGGTAVGSSPINVSANSAANLASNLIQAVRSANVQGIVGPAFDTIAATVRPVPVSPGDWRVRISAPPAVSDLGGEFGAEGSSIIFPVLPSMTLAHRANYTETGLVHTNYLFLAYKNSQTDDITISCEWPVETKDDCAQFVDMVRLGRTLTKMFYGSSNYLGNPPPICTMKGYGEGGVLLPDTPIVVKSFSLDLKDDVNYIEYNDNWIPRLSSVSFQVAVIYNRNTQRAFNLAAYRYQAGVIKY